MNLGIADLSYIKSKFNQKDKGQFIKWNNLSPLKQDTLSFSGILPEITEVEILNEIKKIKALRKSDIGSYQLNPRMAEEILKYFGCRSCMYLRDKNNIKYGTRYLNRFGQEIDIDRRNITQYQKEEIISSIQSANEGNNYELKLPNNSSNYRIHLYNSNTDSYKTIVHFDDISDEKFQNLVEKYQSYGYEVIENKYQLQQEKKRNEIQISNATPIIPIVEEDCTDIDENIDKKIDESIPNEDTIIAQTNPENSSYKFSSVIIYHDLFDKTFDCISQDNQESIMKKIDEISRSKAILGYKHGKNYGNGIYMVGSLNNNGYRIYYKIEQDSLIILSCAQKNDSISEQYAISKAREVSNETIYELIRTHENKKEQETIIAQKQLKTVEEIEENQFQQLIATEKEKISIHLAEIKHNLDTAKNKLSKRSNISEELKEKISTVENNYTLLNKMKSKLNINDCQTEEKIKEIAESAYQLYDDTETLILEILIEIDNLPIIISDNKTKETPKIQTGITRVNKTASQKLNSFANKVVNMLEKIFKEQFFLGINLNIRDEIISAISVDKLNKLADLDMEEYKDSIVNLTAQLVKQESFQSIVFSYNYALIDEIREKSNCDVTKLYELSGQEIQHLREQVINKNRQISLNDKEGKEFKINLNSDIDFKNIEKRFQKYNSPLTEDEIEEIVDKLEVYRTFIPKEILRGIVSNYRNFLTQIISKDSDINNINKLINIVFRQCCLHNIDYLPHPNKETSSSKLDSNSSNHPIIHFGSMKIQSYNAGLSAVFDNAMEDAFTEQIPKKLIKSEVTHQDLIKGFISTFNYTEKEKIIKNLNDTNIFASIIGKKINEYQNSPAFANFVLAQEASILIDCKENAESEEEAMEAYEKIKKLTPQQIEKYREYKQPLTHQERQQVINFIDKYIKNVDNKTRKEINSYISKQGKYILNILSADTSDISKLIISFLFITIDNAYGTDLAKSFDENTVQETQKIELLENIPWELVENLIWDGNEEFKSV